MANESGASTSNRHAPCRTCRNYRRRGQDSPSPFPGERGVALDKACRLDIWDKTGGGFLARFVKVPRDQVVGFALYTHDHGVLKMSAQLYPLQEGEAREVRLELKPTANGTKWPRRRSSIPAGRPTFRIEPWDNTRDVPYRVRHGEKAMFEGLIRKDPIDKDVIVVGSLSCNSNADRGDRKTIVENLKKQDPDLLFFAGDQSYDHKEHTAAWLLWGQQFRDIIKDRPVVTIPDDHDVGQGNLWGEGGIVAESPAGDTGGYFYPAEYIRMLERCQTWHLPDPADPRPIAQGITTYFTRLRVGGVDFAILEDRKFKTGPKGTIPQMGPRPDHIQEPGYDPKKVDLPGLKLLGDRQLAFLDKWGEDWTGAEMKAALSQTAFCGAVHLHGSTENRLLADLDCNGWPQTGRNKALAALRRGMACHLCGDQHLTVVVKHGIDAVPRRSLRLHQSGHHQQLLRSLVVARRREGRRQPDSRQPAAVDRRLSGRSLQSHHDDRLRESRVQQHSGYAAEPARSRRRCSATVTAWCDSTRRRA